MRRIINKRLGIAAGVVAALVLAGGAFAYFTSTGNGSGSANVGTATALGITSTSTGSLYPGTTVPVAITIANKGTGAEYVGTVTPTITTSEPTKCLPEWFAMAPVEVNEEVPAKGSIATSGTLEMHNEKTSQNACQDTTVTVEYASS